MKIQVTMRGLTPYTMHNARLADTEDEIVQEIAAINAKRTKTSEDRQTRERLEFEGGLYMDAGGPAVPAMNLRKCWIEGGKPLKQGTNVARAVLITAVTIPIEYDGPRDVKGLWGDQRYRNRCIVNLNPSRGNKGPRGTRMRPWFPEWTLTVPVELVTSVMEPDMFRTVVQQAGWTEGLGDGRIVGNGRYEASFEEL